MQERTKPANIGLNTARGQTIIGQKEVVLFAQGDRDGRYFNISSEVCKAFQDTFVISQRVCGIAFGG